MRFWHPCVIPYGLMSIRILLADDHRLLRDGLKSLLLRENDIEIVGEADEGRSAVAMAETYSPDVVVMDLSMPDLNGTEATRQIKAKMPAVKVLAVTALADQRSASGALAAGASGYVVKDAAFEELINAIRTVVAQKIYLSPKIASGLV